MQFAQQNSSERPEGFDKEIRELLLNNEEAFSLFLEEAKRKGVKLSLEEPSRTQKGERLDNMKIQDADLEQQSSQGPVITQGGVSSRAVVEVGQTTAGSEASAGLEAQQEILRKLRWNTQESTTSRNLATLLDRIRDMGIEEPNSYLSLRDAAQKSGVAERTLRRYIADGQLETEKVKGPRGWEHRVYVPALFSVLQEKAGAFERARSNPLDEMGRELATLCRAIVEQQTLAERRTNRLLDEIRNQSRVIDELRNEQRDARAQMHGLQDQMIKALMPPQKQSLLQKLFSRD